jgi:hypothetical protein
MAEVHIAPFNGSLHFISRLLIGKDNEPCGVMASTPDSYSEDTRFDLGRRAAALITFRTLPRFP